MSDVNSPISWVTVSEINNAASGDIVGTVKWMNIDYNIIKVIRTWQPRYPYEPHISFWLDKNLDVMTHLMSWDYTSDYGTGNDIPLTDEEKKVIIWDMYGVKYPDNSPNGAIVEGSDGYINIEGTIGSSFHNSLMVSQMYKLLIHPSFELPTMNDFGAAFNHGRPWMADTIPESTWTGMNFPSVSASWYPWDWIVETNYRYWINPLFNSSGGGFTGILNTFGTFGTFFNQYIGMRGVDIKRATSEGDWLNGFEYDLYYFFKKKGIMFTSGIDYTLEHEFPGGFPTDEQLLYDYLEQWVEDQFGWIENSPEWENMFQYAGNMIWRVLGSLGWLQTWATGGLPFPVLTPYTFGIYILYWGIKLAFRDLEDVHLDQHGQLRLKVKDEHVPVKVPKSNITDPIFFGSGY